MLRLCGALVIGIGRAGTSATLLGKHGGAAGTGGADMFPVRPTQRAIFTWVYYATDENNAPNRLHRVRNRKG